MRQLQLGIQRICGARNGRVKTHTEEKGYPKGRRRLKIITFHSVAAVFVFSIFSGSTHAQLPPDRFEAIHSGDVVEVDVEGSLDFDWRGSLTPEGYLDGFNAFGEPIKGWCRMPEEIAADAAAALATTLKDPKVHVLILDRSRRTPAILDGAVRSPHRFRIDRPVRLLELITRSGGITDLAGGTIQIFRPAGASCAGGTPEASTTLEVPISSLIKGDETADPFISPGDLVVVTKASPVYAIGAVRKPRPIPYRTEISLSRFVAMAGGVTKDGDPNRVVIYRKTSDGRVRIEADLDKIDSGKAEDPLLQPLDIVEVLGKGDKKQRGIPEIAGPEAEKSRVLPLVVID